MQSREWRNLGARDGLYYAVHSEAGGVIAVATEESADRLADILNSLERDAAFGRQCWQDRCENAYVEASVAKRLTAACEAALRYDDAIAGRAARGEVDLRDAGGGVATGDDLDALYFDWMEKAREAVAKARN
jgi:hypothetical protein